MKKDLTECKVCFSSELVKVTTKDTKITLVVCRECDQIYELDEAGNPVLNHDPKDVNYFKNLEKIFGNWDNVENIVPYNE